MMRLHTENEVNQHEQLNSPTASEGEMIYTLKQVPESYLSERH